MPRISLSDNIKVLGDYFAAVNQESAVKSTFRMFIDYEEVVKSAFAGAKVAVKRAKDITEQYDHDNDPLTEEVDCLPVPSRADFDKLGLTLAAKDGFDAVLELWNE